MKSIFFSYSHKDEALRNQLEVHLTMLKRQGIISTWHDRRLVAGDNVNDEIATELNRTDVILLLISPDFLASEYCYGVEVSRALERHAAGEARVIPVILRPCDWQSAPFGKLLAAPTDGRPVTKWADPDEAFLDITKAIRAAVGAPGDPAAAPFARSTATKGTAAVIGPRSSNLRLRKTFSERDRDQFLHDSYEFIARFFENSLKELEARNSGIETSFRRIDANRFVASIYRDGTNVAHCQIRLGGFMNGISFSYSANPDDSSSNESMSVEADEQVLSLRALGMPMRRGQSESSHLGHEGAAEYYWSLLIDRLQR